MSIRISTHAVERYIDRIDPKCSTSQAYEIIERLMSSASRQREKTHTGDTIYLTSACRLIVAEENGHREVLTVVPLYSDPKDLRAMPEMARYLKEEYEIWEKDQDNQSTTESKLRYQISCLMVGIEKRQRFIDQAINSKVDSKGMYQLKEQNEALKKKLDKQKQINEHLTKDVTTLKRKLALISHLVLSDNLTQAQNEVNKLEKWMIRVDKI